MKDDFVTLRVELNTRGYPIYIGSGLLSRAGSILPFDIKERKIFILYDRNVESHVQKLMEGLPPATATMVVEGGEPTKSYTHLQSVLDWLLEKGVNRNSVLFVVGGGVLGDLGGFAASIVLRGIPFVQVPTTLLAQVDSSVGGKTGINSSKGKNLIGSFYQPSAVLCDLETLRTLPERELKAGYAEIVKYGLLGSHQYFEWLEGNGKDVLSLKPDALAYAVETSCSMKAQIVGRDEYEQAGGDRALLNLGHTFAHALEAAAGYDGRLLHGEAVSIGMVLAFRLCAKMGICSGQDAVRMEKHLKSCGLKTEISDIQPKLQQTADEIVSLMAHDKKAVGSKIGFILVRGIGQAFQSTDMDINDVITVVRESLKLA